MSGIPLAGVIVCLAVSAVIHLRGMELGKDIRQGAVASLIGFLATIAALLAIGWHLKQQP